MPNGKIVEIRWHARGGQGAVIASRFLAASALRDNLYFQAVPQFGTERMGAPIVAYTRLSEEPIDLRCAINEPDVVVVLDPTLLSVVDVTSGLKKGGVLIVNYPGSPADLAKEAGIDLGMYKVHTIDATKISTEELGRPIPNTPMVGALAKCLGMIALDNILAEFEVSLTERFKGRGNVEKLVQGNLRAVKRAYEEVQAS